MRAPIVLDTNIVLDVFVFNDTVTLALKTALQACELDWLATQPMRDELARVLAYPKIVSRLVLHQLSGTQVLENFDKRVRLLEIAPKAGVTCRDADDQKFIDLAVAHQAVLLSKDGAVLSMSKRLAGFGVLVRCTF